MRLIILVALVLFIFTPANAQEAKTGAILAPDKYDDWGDVQFSEEQLHLKKIARQAKEWHLSIIYLVIYAGQRACKGEAEARGIRAQDYLLKEGIEPERIVWIDGGWKKTLAVDVWIWPLQFGRPKPTTDDTLKRSQITIERNCKIKFRGK